VLWRIFGPKREQVRGGWRGLHDDQLHNVYTSPKYYSDDQIKEDETGGEMLHGMEIGEVSKIFWSENLKGRDHLEDLGVDGKIVLE
jgi:hypothetical protein